VTPRSLSPLPAAAAARAVQKRAAGEEKNIHTQGLKAAADTSMGSIPVEDNGVNVIPTLALGKVETMVAERMEEVVIVSLHLCLESVLRISTTKSLAGWVWQHKCLQVWVCMYVLQKVDSQNDHLYKCTCIYTRIDLYIDVCTGVSSSSRRGLQSRQRDR